MTAERPRPVTFLCEATVGHTAFLSRLQAASSARRTIAPTWHALTPAPEGWLERLPPFSQTWTGRASVRARRRLRHPALDPEALFFHTLAPAMLSVGAMKRIPSVVSVDATPINVDELAAAYRHSISAPWLEAVKKWGVHRVFSNAAFVVAWSEWVARSLRDDYGVAPSQIVVQPPGVPLGQYTPAAESPRAPGPVRLLFVGADFERKGGNELLAALPHLRGAIELDVVSTAAIDAPPGVRVHASLTPDHPDLVALYRKADVFVLPTRGDTYGHVVVEAMAAGLAVVTTNVGAVGEAVIHEDTGLLIPPQDEGALVQALQGLIDAPQRRLAMGRRGRQRAVEKFDGDRNLGRILDVVEKAATSHRVGRRREV